MMRIGKLLPFILCLVLCLEFIPENIRGKSLHLDIHGPGQKELNILLSSPKPLFGDKLKSPQRAGKLKELLLENLGYLPFLEIVSKQKLLGDDQIQGIKLRNIDFKRLRMSGLDLFLTIGWQSRESGKGIVEIRVFNVYSPEMLVGKGYIVGNPRQIVRAADRFCAALMQELAGSAGFFKSRLAFVKKKSDSKKEIYTSTPQGNLLKKISNSKGIYLSPSWSWDAQHLAFTQIDKGEYKLKIWNKSSGRIERILLPGNTVISPAFTPNGDLVVSADPRGNPNIYLLNEDFELGELLVQNWGIDISPGFDKKGEKMTFVSSRLGNPHIFVLDMKTEKVSRVSMQGNYNTEPAISPQGKYLAYTRKTEKGHRIVLHNMQTGKERRLTSGPNNDEDPAWGPDGYFLMFSSNRSGKYKLYLTTRFGSEAQIVETGGGSTTGPAWSPAIE